MKKLTIILVSLLFCSTIFAQTYFDVTPGYGTLNVAVTAHQGNVIYRLQAGQWYGLNGQIENSGFTLQIIGTTPSVGQMPAEIQTATNADGTVLSNMFSVFGDVYMKDVFIVNADANNTLGQGVFSVGSATSVRIVFDSLTVDPIGSNHFLVFSPTLRPKLYLTNSLLMRHGNLDGANDFLLFDLEGPVGNGYDTLYLENNTMLSTGVGIGNWGNAPGSDSDNFVWVNHNTFIFHKFTLLNQLYFPNSYFVTNNLFFDFNVLPYNVSWDAYTPDGFADYYQSQIEEDTAASDWVNGQVHSTRKAFAEYNSWYLDPRITAYTTTWASSHTKNNDGVTPLDSVFLIQFLYPKTPKLNRESQMFNSSGFPYFKFGNFSDQADPQWTDHKIYSIQDSIVNWALPAMELNNWGFSPSLVTPPASSGNWWWCADSVYNLGNPVVWPRFNGSYTNSTMLTASTEGLPLGDLNWFPNKKAIWNAHQSALMQHIENEDTTQYIITGIRQENNQIPNAFSLSQNYPNPFNPSTIIKYSVRISGVVTLKVYNSLGQEIATLVNQEQNAGNYNITFDASKLASGVYMYRIQSGDFSLTKKMTLLK